MKKSVFQAMCVAMLSLLLGACGFHMQGRHDYPFKHLYIVGAPSLAMAARMKRAIEGGSDTQVLTSPAGADAILTMSVGRGQSALSFDINGVVQEYVLTTSVNYQLISAKGNVLIPPSSLSVNRAMSYSNQYALAKQNEATLLNADMDSDIADQLLRRLDVVTTLDSTRVQGVGSRAPLPTPPL